MSEASALAVTELLAAAGQGDAAARSRLLSAVYHQLHAEAKRQMADERPGHTLQTTALVDEAYLRLLGNDPVAFANRGHFFAAAAEAMRRILVEHARNRLRLKRGGEARREPITESLLASREWDPAELLALDEALQKLESLAPRQADVVKLRFFAGLSVDDAAKALSISPRTLDADWRLARAWLHRELGEDVSGSEDVAD